MDGCLEIFLHVVFNFNPCSKNLTESFEVHFYRARVVWPQDNFSSRNTYPAVEGCRCSAQCRSLIGANALDEGDETDKTDEEYG